MNFDMEDMELYTEFIREIANQYDISSFPSFYNGQDNYVSISPDLHAHITETMRYRILKNRKQLSEHEEYLERLGL